MNVIDLLIGKIISVLNVRGTDYVKTYEMAEELNEESALPVSSSIVYEAVQNDIASEVESLQTKALSVPVSINGASVDTVEEAISALAANGTATPAAGSTKFFTAGGAYTDKATVPQSGNNKNFTAGGAFSDKSDVPAEGDTRNFTAGGALNDKTNDVTEGSTKNLTSRGFRTDIANSTDGKYDTRNITAGKALESFNSISDPVKWLGRALGRQLGRTWHQGSVTNTNYATMVAFADGQFVAGINAQGLWYSSDGKSWEHVQGVSGTFRWAKKLNGKWVAGGTGGVYASDDTVTWTKILSASNYTGMEYIGGVYVAVQNDSTSGAVWAFWSEDLATWTRCTYDGAVGITLTFVDVAMKNGIIAAVASSSSVHPLVWTEDGKVWHKANTDVSGSGYCIRNLNGTFVADISGTVYYSSNGKSWSRCTGVARLTDAIHGFGVSVAVSANIAQGPVWSRNGVDWYHCVLGGGAADLSSFYCYSVWYACGLFLTCGYPSGSSGTRGLYYSVDGMHWYRCSTKITYVPVHGMTFGNGNWVLATGTDSTGSNVKLYYSGIEDVI